MSDTSQGPGWWQASDRKWYPPAADTALIPPVPPVRKSPRQWRTWQLAVAAVVALVLGLAIGAAGKKDAKTAAPPASTAAKPGGNPSTVAPATSPRTTSAPPTQASYSVGQTAHTGDFDVTLNTVENPYTPTNRFEKPPAGQHFVGVELTVKNTTSDQKTMSTLMGAEVTDSLSRPWHSTFAGVDRPQLDGTVAANDSRRGWIFFALPDDATGLKLRMKGSLTATGSLFVLG